MHTSWSLPMPGNPSPLGLRLPAPGSSPPSPLYHANSHRSTWRAQMPEWTPLLNHLSPGLPSLTGSSCPPSVPRPASRGLVRVQSSRHVPRVKLTSAISRFPTPIVSAGPLCLAQNRSSAVPWPVRVERLASSVSRQLQSHVYQPATVKRSQARRRCPYLQEISYQSSLQQ